MIDCSHMIIDRCKHPEASRMYGDRPSRGVCLRACRFYDGNEASGTMEYGRRTIQCYVCGNEEPFGKCTDARRCGSTCKRRTELIKARIPDEQA